MLANHHSSALVLPIQERLMLSESVFTCSLPANCNGSYEIKKNSNDCIMSTYLLNVHVSHCKTRRGVLAAVSQICIHKLYQLSWSDTQGRG